MKAIGDMLKHFLLDGIKGRKSVVITHYTWSNISLWFPCCLFCLGFQHSFGYSQWTTGAQAERRWLRNSQKEEERRGFRDNSEETGVLLSKSNRWFKSVKDMSVQGIILLFWWRSRNSTSAWPGEKGLTERSVFLDTGVVWFPFEFVASITTLEQCSPNKLVVTQSPLWLG